MFTFFFLQFEIMAAEIEVVINSRLPPGEVQQDSFNIKIDRHETVEILLQKICLKRLSPMHHDHVLTFKNQTLKRECELIHYGLDDGSIVYWTNSGRFPNLFHSHCHSPWITLRFLQFTGYIYLNHGMSSFF